MTSGIGRFRRLIHKLIDAISFNSQIRTLADTLNRKVEHVDDGTQNIFSHPGGFTRALHKRRISIAELYIRLTQTKGSSQCKERLQDLKTLVQLSLHAKTISMPLNTARVQIELMKEAIKNKANKRKQMEIINNFTIASFGHESVIRYYLRELKLVEVPENGKPLKYLDMGWDSHVHDSLSEGRKTPSQLMLDAFIKGISRITVVHYDLSDKDIIYETMNAGKILGIDLTIGIEFSIGKKGQRKKYIYILPVNNYEEFLEFFEKNREKIGPFIEGLEENKRKRRDTIIKMLEDFNKTHLNNLNQDYLHESILCLPPLMFDDLKMIVPEGHYSRIHLSEILYKEYRNVLKKRVLKLKVQYEVSKQLLKKGKMSNWELEKIESSYYNTRKYYESLTPQELRNKYFSDKSFFDYDSVFTEEKEILPILKDTKGKIIYAYPLMYGLEKAICNLINNYQYIDMIEVINLYENANRNPAEIMHLARFIDLINNGTLDSLKNFLNDLHINSFNPEIFQKAYEHFHKNRIIPITSSASTGKEPNIPGMGFIKEISIPKKSRQHFAKSHYYLPYPISELVILEGKRGELPEEKGRILCLGKRKPFNPNLVGDEEQFERIGLFRLWRYLNPKLKNLIRVGIGIIPAHLWMTSLYSSLGDIYAGIWFGITFIRNLFVDLISMSGIRPKEWQLKHVNFENIAQSLFWTGFSIPILGLVKQGFDQLWPIQPPSGPFFEWSKFLVICIANGSYISFHNKLRRFDNRVIRVNFFRSVLAWPFASLFSPLGNFFNIPSIVQAKFWSDFVAGFIEGYGKFKQRIVLRKRDLSEIIPLLKSNNKEEILTAMLDILYIWAKLQRGKTALYELLTRKDVVLGRVKRIFKRKKKIEPEFNIPEDTLDLMLQLFSPQYAEAELSVFILKKYTDSEAVFLTDLIITSLVPFNKWLKKLKKKIK